tara:strand:- start:1016 stop:1297 length:282 start_codon:yes stop_codon:yes gene_type:complete
MASKKNNLKKVFTFLKPILRGAIKSLPFGNAVVEIGESIKESVDNVKNDSAKPLTHNWLSIAVQIIGMAVIIYAFFTKAITIEQVLEFIGFNA